MIISANYRRKTISGLEPSFMWDASLSFFPLWNSVYVWAIFLWRQEQHVHCRVTACWICSPGPLSQASSSSEALDDTELLDSRLLLSSGMNEVVTTLAYFQNITEPKWHCLTLSLNHNQCQQSVQIFRWAPSTMASCLVISFYTNTKHHYEMLNLKMQALYATHHCGCKLSPKSEKWNAISSPKLGPSKEKDGR